LGVEGIFSIYQPDYKKTKPMFISGVYHMVSEYLTFFSHVVLSMSQAMPVNMKGQDYTHNKEVLRKNKTFSFRCLQKIQNKVFY